MRTLTNVSIIVRIYSEWFAICNFSEFHIFFFVSSFQSARLMAGSMLTYSNLISTNEGTETQVPVFRSTGLRVASWSGQNFECPKDFGEDPVDFPKFGEHIPIQASWK